MRKFLILIILFFGCTNSLPTNMTFNTVKEIDYTFDSGWKESYSLKINHEGVCIVGDGKWSMKYYTGQLTSGDIEGLDSLLKSPLFKQYDSVYQEDIVDQASYKIVVIGIRNDTTTKFVYGRNAPKLLNDFSNRLRLIKESLKLQAREDTVVDFISRKNFFPQSVKLP